jgi:hypothetical protein
LIYARPVEFLQSPQRDAFLKNRGSYERIKVVFVTQKQFECLQKRLFRSMIRRHLLDSLLLRRKLPQFDYVRVLADLSSEMDRTLFVPNSDSSQINSFVHVNSDAFNNREGRNLVGLPIQFWTYASQHAASSAPDIATAAHQFDELVLKADPHLHGKSRLVVLEDFSGSGTDLRKSLDAVEQADLPFDEVLVAPVIATAAAAKRLQDRCSKLSLRSSRKYLFLTAQVLPKRLQCLRGRADSYLDGDSPVPHLSPEIRRISEDLFVSSFSKCKVPLRKVDRHGFRGLALAFATYTNCPDNSLPMLWKTTTDWVPLFPRASRII